MVSVLWALVLLLSLPPVVTTVLCPRWFFITFCHVCAPFLNSSNTEVLCCYQLAMQDVAHAVAVSRLHIWWLANQQFKCRSIRVGGGERGAEIKYGTYFETVFWHVLTMGLCRRKLLRVRRQTNSTLLFWRYSSFPEQRWRGEDQGMMVDNITTRRQDFWCHLWHFGCQAKEGWAGWEDGKVKGSWDTGCSLGQYGGYWTSSAASMVEQNGPLPGGDSWRTVIALGQWADRNLL